MLSERLESSPPMSFRNRPVLPRALSGGPTLARKPRILRPPPPTEGPACPDGPSQQMRSHLLPRPLVPPAAADGASPLSALLTAFSAFLSSPPLADRLPQFPMTSSLSFQF